MSMFIVSSTDADAVARVFSHDPFARAGLVDDVRITEWTPAIDDFTG